MRAVRRQKIWAVTFVCGADFPERMPVPNKVNKNKTPEWGGLNRLAVQREARHITRVLEYEGSSHAFLRGQALRAKKLGYLAEDEEPMAFVFHRLRLLIFYAAILRSGSSVQRLCRILFEVGRHPTLHLPRRITVSPVTVSRILKTETVGEYLSRGGSVNRLSCEKSKAPIPRFVQASPSIEVDLLSAF